MLPAPGQQRLCMLGATRSRKSWTPCCWANRFITDSPPLARSKIPLCYQFTRPFKEHFIRIASHSSNCIYMHTNKMILTRHLELSDYSSGHQHLSKSKHGDVTIIVCCREAQRGWVKCQYYGFCFGVSTLAHKKDGSQTDHVLASWTLAFSPSLLLRQCMHVILEKYAETTFW